MVTTRRQASTVKLPSVPVKPVNESDSEDTDSSSDIPATASTIRKTGPSYGPTLRPTKTRPEISPLKRKRDSIHHAPPTKKRQKRAGADYETTTQSALESINAFRPDHRASPRIMIPLPTSTQLLADMQENRQLPVRGESVGLGTRDRTPMSMDHGPPLGRILFGQQRLAGPAGGNNKQTASNLEVAESGPTIVVREAPGQDLYTIQESPQVSRPFGDPPITDIESPTRRHGDHSGPNGTEKSVDHQDQIDPIDAMQDSDYEEDRPERGQETQYQTARDRGSPDLGSDQLAGDIYDIPGELEPPNLPLATGNFEGMTHKAKQKVGVMVVTRVPKIPHFLSGSAGSSHSSSMPVHEYIAQINSQSPPSMPTQPMNVHKVPNWLPRMPPLVDSSQLPPPGAQQILSSPQVSDVDMGDGEAQHTATVPSGPVQKMHKLMGQPGWTELGKGWSRDLLEDPDPFGDVDVDVDDESQAQNPTPTRTILGGKLFKLLVSLTKTFTKAPSAPEFEAQNRWLLQKQQSLNKYTSEIDKLVKKICEDRLAVLGESTRPTSNDLEFRKALVRDLVLCLVPMLVHTLWHAFCLGGFDVDAVTGVKGLPIEEGEFTTTTLQYVARLTRWLIRLDRLLMFELEQRPFYHRLVDGLSEKNKVEYPAQCRKRRGQLGNFLGRLKVDVDTALRDMDKKANDERRRAERIQMENSIKAAKEQAIREAEERVRKQNEAFARCTQELRADSMREEEEKRNRYRAFAQSVQTVRETSRATQNNMTARNHAYDERAGREISHLYKALHKGPRPWEKTRPGAAATSSRARPSNENGGYNGHHEQEDEDECSSVTEASDRPEAEDNDEADPFARQTPPSRWQAQRAQRQQLHLRLNDHHHPVQQAHQDKPTHTPWPEEDKYELLKAIRREKPGQRLIDIIGYEAIAEVLQKPLEEVKLEAAILRKAARQEAREKGWPIPRWAVGE